MSEKSSRFDEYEHRMAFTDETDFEGGQWINGEYYYKNSNRTQYKQSKEEALYGIFYGSSDEEDGRGRRRGRARREGREVDLSKPLDFVGAGSNNSTSSRDSSKATKETTEKEEGEAEDANSEVSAQTQEQFRSLLKESGHVPGKGPDETAAQLARGTSKGNEAFRRMIELQQEEERQKMEEAERRKKKPKAKLDSKFGSFEQHTKGIGLKLLQKMGFKGRLGKEETGVTRVQEAKVRPGGIGLGFGGFKEASKLKVNREIEADLQGKTLEELNKEQGISDDEEGGPRKRKKKEKNQAEKEARAGNWRKGGKKRKMKFLTAEEMLEQQQEEGKDLDQKADQQLVVDMRGPQAKLLANLDEINYAPDQEVEAKPLLGQELLHNIDLLVSMSESRLFSLERKRKSFQDQLLALGKDMEHLSGRVDDQEDRAERLAAVSKIIERVDSTLKKDASAVSVNHVLKVFKTLQENYPEEYAVFNLAQLAPTLAAPVLKSKLEGWDVQLDPMMVVELLARWKPVLSKTSVNSEMGEVNPLMSNENDVAFDFLFSEYVMPQIRHTLVNEWEVRNTQPIVSLMEGLQPVINSETHGYLLTMLILPKLTHAVSTWDPTQDVVPIHQWLHPWLPLLGSKLSVIYPDIRRKLQHVLKDWHPADQSALIIIKPWVGVFDERSLEQLVVKSIVPKLVLALRELVINPLNQQLDQFNWVIAWADIVPELHFVSLLQGEFFPKWINTLYQWLTQDPDYEEVTRWYLGWKEMIPESVRASPVVIAQLNQALALMNQVLTDRASLGVYMRPGAVESMSYLQAVEARKMEEAAVRKQQKKKAEEERQASSAQQQQASQPQISFKEVVEMFAENNGVSFFPKSGRWHNGKQIYSFGGMNIYLDQDVAFFESSKVLGSAWEPIALETLLQYIQNKQA